MQKAKLGINEDRDFTLGDGCTKQHVHDALLSYILETYIILLINVTPILNKKKQIALFGINLTQIYLPSSISAQCTIYYYRSLPFHYY